MKELPVRKNVRLHDYDYSKAGCYYITICVKDRHELLGRVVGAITNRPNQDANTVQVELTEYGHIIEQTIIGIPVYYPYVSVDKYTIMPNHIHILFTFRYSEMWIDGGNERNLDKDGRLIIAPTTLSNVVRQFKRHVTREIGFSMWQKSFHDRIIRNETEYQRVWRYIDENPARWADDVYHQ